MTVAHLGLGLVVFAGTAGGALLAAVLLVARRLGHLRGAERALAVGVVGVAALVLAHLAPGVLGILSRWSALVVALVLATLASRIPVAALAREAAPPPAPPSPLASRALAVLAAAGVLVALLARTWEALGHAPIGVDATTFHLPVIASWIQTGSLWGVHQFDPNLANGDYPQTGDLLELAFVLPWHDIAFAPLDGPILLAGAALAAALAARQLGAARASAALVGLLAVAAPVVLGSANGLTDPLLLFGLAAGVLFLVRDLRAPCRAERLLAALALGLAFGTKWYGVWAAPAVLVAWALAATFAGRAPRAVVRATGTIGALGLVTGGFWLVRNLVSSGDPVFPVRVAALGVTIWGAPRDVLRECVSFPLAHYATQPRVWRTWIVPGWREALGLPGLVAALGLVLAFVLGLRARARCGLVLVATAVLLLVLYALTPDSATGPQGAPIGVAPNARYASPALLVAAVALGWALGRVRGRARLALELVVAVAVIQGAWKGALPGVTIVLGALGVVVAGALLARMRAPRLALAGTAVLLVVALGIRQDDLHDTDYRDRGAPLAWLADHAPHGTRVALAGVWNTIGPAAPLPALGPALDREIGYPGHADRGLLRPYETRRQWAAALRRGRYDLVLIGLDRSRYAACPRLRGADVNPIAWAVRSHLRPVAHRRARVSPDRAGSRVR